MSRVAAEVVAAWATGVGVGLLVFMVSWLMGHRIAALIWDRPTGPIVALGTAVLVGAIMTILAGRHLSRATRDGTDDGSKELSRSHPAS
jgi:hypothetical protein